MAEHESSTPAASGRRPRGKKATLTDYANLKFEALPESIITDLGTEEGWLDRARDDWNVMHLAVQVLLFDHDQLAEKSGQEPEGHGELMRCCSATAEQFQGYAKLLEGAHVRLMAAGARHLVAAGEA